MTARIAVIVALLAAGCGHSGDSIQRELLCECFAEAAYVCVVAESANPADEQSPEKPCCGECGGTGKVLSGDRLALVDCECDPSCPCKSGKSSCKPGEPCHE